MYRNCVCVHTLIDEGYGENSYYSLPPAPFDLTVVEQLEVHAVHLAVGGR